MILSFPGGLGRPGCRTRSPLESAWRQWPRFQSPNSASDPGPRRTQPEPVPARSQPDSDPASPSGGSESTSLGQAQADSEVTPVWPPAGPALPAPRAPLAGWPRQALAARPGRGCPGSLTHTHRRRDCRRRCPGRRRQSRYATPWHWQATDRRAALTPTPVLARRRGGQRPGPPAGRGSAELVTRQPRPGFTAAGTARDSDGHGTVPPSPRRQAGRRRARDSRTPGRPGGPGLADSEPPGRGLGPAPTPGPPPPRRRQRYRGLTRHVVLRCSLAH